MPGERDLRDLVRACRAEGVRDPRILDAIGSVRRDAFVPPRHVHEAYEDRPIPIPRGQVTTQPSLIARMVEALRLTGTERVLEIGTGLGYQAAVLARLCSDVYTLERFPELAEQARSNLDAAGVRNVTVVAGDGTLGLPEHAPFQGIIVAAASPRVPPPLAEQLSEGGRLVHPVGPGGREDVTVFRKEGSRLVREGSVVPAHFVRLVGRHGQD